MPDGLYPLSESSSPQFEESTKPKLQLPLGLLILVIVIIANIGVTLVLLSYKGAKTLQIKGVETEIEELKQEEAKYQDLEKKAQIIQKQLANLQNLFANQKYYDQFLATLSANLPKDTFLENLSVAEGKKVTLSGTTSNYVGLAYTLEALRIAPILDANNQPVVEKDGTSKKAFNKVKLTSSNIEQKDRTLYCRFSVELEINPLLLQKKITQTKTPSPTPEQGE